MRNLSLHLVLPVVLIALVLALAVLQYQWLGKVSEAERAQMLRSLTQRAREFAADFDAEMTAACLAHQVTRDTVTANRFDGLVESITRWQGVAKFPQMVRAVYLAERVDEKYTLRTFNHTRGTFEESPLPAWPAHLESVRTQLVGSAVRPDSPAGGKAQFFSISLMPAQPDVPALVVPVVSQNLPAVSADASSATALRNSMIWMRAIDACVVVDLDATYLKTTVLPTMAARHFPDLGANGYRMSVVSSSGASLFARDVPEGQSLNPDRADVTQSFFTVRPDLLRGGPTGGNTLIVRSFVAPTTESISHASPGTVVGDGRMSVVVEQRSAPATAAAGGTGGSAPGPGTTSARGVTGGIGAIGPAGAGQQAGQFRFVMPVWRVILQHPSGSLDAAVSQARRRNLWLSFGILGVLTAGLVIVIVNARRAEQLAARRMDFVATVSHELRTPLAVIRSAAQNLSAGVVSDPAHARAYGELIDGEGRRLTDMVEQVMTLAGLESGKPLQGMRQVDVPALVTDVMASCDALCDASGITVELDAGSDANLPAVMADEAALRRALQNLVTNAVKHGTDGRWIGVTVSAPVVRGASEIQIVVSDRGRGIDPADLAHVFEPFHRGRHAIDQQVHGNGLGLHLVKLIASAHGGRVSVQSTPGHGATFTLHLPVVP